MTDQKESAESNEAKKIILAREIVKESIWLQFTGLDDLRELIQFTGRKPRISDDLNLRIGSKDIIAPCMVCADREGNIVSVLSPGEFKKNYEVKAEKPFSASFSANKMK